MLIKVFVLFSVSQNARSQGRIFSNKRVKNSRESEIPTLYSHTCSVAKFCKMRKQPRANYHTTIETIIITSINFQSKLEAIRPWWQRIQRTGPDRSLGFSRVHSLTFQSRQNDRSVSGTTTHGRKIYYEKKIYSFHAAKWTFHCQSV